MAAWRWWFEDFCRPLLNANGLLPQLECNTSLNTQFLSSYLQVWYQNSSGGIGLTWTDKSHLWSSFVPLCVNTHYFCYTGFDVLNYRKLLQTPVTVYVTYRVRDTSPSSNPKHLEMLKHLFPWKWRGETVVSAGQPHPALITVTQVIAQAENPRAGHRAEDRKTVGCKSRSKQHSHDPRSSPRGQGRHVWCSLLRELDLSNSLQKDCHLPLTTFCAQEGQISPSDCEKLVWETWPLVPCEKEPVKWSRLERFLHSSENRITSSCNA